ncbi:predicted protein, partial [Thalassiosira pseudonana CCMP1335]
RNIVVLCGAGISVSCGIPDFRSQTGLYNTLNYQELGLSSPEDLFDIETFLDDPTPFYRFAKTLYPGKVIPSASHRFLAWLNQRQMLLRVYTQNIDGLEEQAGVMESRVVYAHGSLLGATCVNCRATYRADEIADDVQTGKVPLKAGLCGGVIKPNITFFGEKLGNDVGRSLQKDYESADALIVMGTSLSVAPMSKVVEFLPQHIPRILINR